MEDARIQMARDVEDATFDQVRSSLEMIANQAINLSEPETIKQGKDNLVGLARLVLSACASHGITRLNFRTQTEQQEKR